MSMKSASLLAQVMVLRWAGVLMASFAVPLTYAISRAVTARAHFALGCAAIVAVMPEFATNLARVSNEPLAILLFTLLTWMGLHIVTKRPERPQRRRPGSHPGAGAADQSLLLGRRTASRHTAVVQARKVVDAGADSVLVAASIAGWWYIRNLADHRYPLRPRRAGHAARSAGRLRCYRRSRKFRGSGPPM